MTTRDVQFDWRFRLRTSSMLAERRTSSSLDRATRRDQQQDRCPSGTVTTTTSPQNSMPYIAPSSFSSDNYCILRRALDLSLNPNRLFLSPAFLSLCGAAVAGLPFAAGPGWPLCFSGSSTRSVRRPPPTA